MRFVPMFKKKGVSSPPQRQRRSAWHIFKHVARRVHRHECVDSASAMAFDFLFSIFPAALFAATLILYLNVPSERVLLVLDLMGIFLHEMMQKLIEDNIKNLVETGVHAGGILTVGFIGALWVGSSAVSATIRALNRTYGVQETRSFIRLRLLSLQLMVGVGLAMVVSFNLLILWSRAEMLLHSYLGLEHFLPSIIGILKWPVGFFCVIFMAGMLYRAAPNCKPRFREVLPGAVLFTLLWYFLSVVFGSYVSNSVYYTMITGMFWVFVVLMLWVYMTALFLLIGGELNAEIFHGDQRPPA